MIVNWDTKSSSNMKINLLTWLNRNVEGAMNFVKVPHSKLLLSSFSSHLQLLLSMLSITAGEQSDRYIWLAKLTIAYLISHLKTLTIYNWSVAISDGISEQLEKIDEGSHFAYASYNIWLLIHQNLDFFTKLTLVKHDGSGSLKSIDKWTKEVRLLVDYYGFVENFLVLAMSLIPLAIPRLSVASKLYLWMPYEEIKDWFFSTLR